MKRKCGSKSHIEGSESCPISYPVKGYAIKTAKGYIATQGRYSWLQDTPDGWSLYSSKQGAIDALSNTLEIGDIVSIK